MLFTLLGEVGAIRAGERLDLGPPQRRAVLAALLTDAGRTVGAETLVRRVWGEEPPAGVRSALYAHLARLRSALSPVRLSRRGAGYILDIAPDDVDVHRFHELCARARPGRSDEEELLRSALAVWGGEPLAGITGPWAEAVRVRWNDERLDMLVRWAELAVARDAFAEVTGVLPAYTDQFPLSERLLITLMRALHGTGRTAEAVDRYAVFRERLADELGISPGPELQRAHVELLRGEETPSQLPPVVAQFVGRAGELARLDTLSGPAVAVISGGGGVGKTTLAVRWAEHARSRFPDGRLYLDLRGFGPDRPTEPVAALQALLVALGVPGDEQPTGRDARTALFRTRTAGKCMLIVLDNARDAAQVRPLLPASPGILTVVTSRDRLTSLNATGETTTIVLQPLLPDQAMQLLALRIGGPRVASEQDAAQRIAAACAGLPLALAIAAARIRESGDSASLTAFADELDEDGGLDAFDAGDPAGRLRVVLTWSYRALGPGLQRAFRLFGLHPGPDLTASAMAALSADDVPAARRLLRGLARASLITEHVPGRFVMHTLLRAFADDLSAASDDRSAPLLRLTDHYVAAGYSAARALDPVKCVMPEHMEVAERSVPGSPEAWLSAELANLLAVARAAAGHGFARQTWQLAWALSSYLRRHGDWLDMLALGSAAVTAAASLGYRLGEAHGNRIVADAETVLSRYDEATAHLRIALAHYQRLDAMRYQADVHLQLAVIAGNQHDGESAQRDAQEAMTLYRKAGFDRGLARALNTGGWYQALQGRYEDAIVAGEEALALFARLRDPQGEGATWDTMGYAQQHLGDLDDAAASFRQAVRLARDAGDRLLEATALNHLGDVCAEQGDEAGARYQWIAALAVLDQLEHDDAKGVRAKLGPVLAPQG